MIGRGLLLLAIFITHNSWCAEMVGTISKVKGNVMFFLNEKGRKAKEGAKFFIGDTVITGPDGRVKLRFNEGGPDGKNEVVVGASSRFLIEKSIAANKKSIGSRLSLERGSLRATVRKKYSGKGEDIFEIRTPNAVAGVRGTIFLMNYDADTRISTLLTKQGIVSILLNSMALAGTTKEVSAGEYLMATSESYGKVTFYSKDLNGLPKEFLIIEEVFGDQASSKSFESNKSADNSPDSKNKSSNSNSGTSNSNSGTSNSSKTSLSDSNVGELNNLKPIPKNIDEHNSLYQKAGAPMPDNKATDSDSEKD